MTRNTTPNKAAIEHALTLYERIKAGDIRGAKIHFRVLASYLDLPLVNDDEEASLGSQAAAPEVFGTYQERNDGTTEFRRSGDPHSPTAAGYKSWPIYAAPPAPLPAHEAVPVAWTDKYELESLNGKQATALVFTKEVAEKICQGTMFPLYTSSAGAIEQLRQELAEITTKLMHCEAKLALVDKPKRFDDADRIRREALEEIANQDWAENCLDPQWAARIARAALDNRDKI